MLKMNIEIETSNDAFVNDPHLEIRGALLTLESVLSGIATGAHEDGKEWQRRMPLKDTNGNRVGVVTVTND